MREVGEILRRQAAMESTRSTWEQHWREVAERVLPRQDDFFGKRQPGEKRTIKVFDSTAIYGLQRFAAIMESILTPRTQLWHKLKPKGGDDTGGPIGEWFDDVNRRLFDARYSPSAAFASNAHEGYVGLGAFGTTAMFISDSPGSPLWYRLCHIAEIYFAEDAWGRIDTVHRKFTMTARQVVQMFGPDDVPASVRGKADRSPEDEIDVLHCTYPNEDMIVGREDADGMPYRSVYVLPEHTAVVRTGGYTSWPWAISRYVTAPREIYGRSPAMDALPDIKTLNEAAKSRLKSWHYANDPMLLVTDDGVLTRLNVRPGAISVGGVDDQGRPRVLPMTNNARLDIDQAMTGELRSGVNDAFLVSLFQILVDSPNMTATEVLERAREKGALLAPVMGRQHSEFLGPMLAREMDLMARAGRLPPPPPELIEMGGEYDVEYVSPLSNASRAEEALSVVRTIDQLAPLAGIKPEVWDNIDADEAYAIIARANSTPNKLTAAPEVVEALRQQRAKQQAMNAALAAGPAVGQTVSGISRAVA